MQQMINLTDLAFAKALALSHVRSTESEKVVILDAKDCNLIPYLHNSQLWNARQQEILNADLIINICEVVR